MALSGASALFENRTTAGQELADKLAPHGRKNAIVLALPRGGVVVGREVARALKLPLDVVVARKIGAPKNPEFGVGAISEGDTLVLSECAANMNQQELNHIIAQEKKELARRVTKYREGRPLPPLKGKTVLLIDDGLATGVTAQSAIAAVKKHNPHKIVFAAPVCAFDTAHTLERMVDTVVCSQKPRDMAAIGLFYKKFLPVEDEEVVAILKKTRERQHS